MTTDKNIETRVYYYCLDVILCSSSNELDVNNIQSTHCTKPIKRRTPVKDPPSIEMNSEGVGSFGLSVKSFLSEHDKEIPLSKIPVKCLSFIDFVRHFVLSGMLGLRGAVAFALALRNTKSVPRQMMLTSVLIVVLVTVIVNGGATMSVLSFLKIR